MRAEGPQHSRPTSPTTGRWGGFRASRTEFDSAVAAGAVGAMVSAIGDWTPDV